VTIIHVDASQGNDKTGTGTKKKPLRTFAAARKLFIKKASERGARNVRKPHIGTVVFAPGHYYPEHVQVEKGMNIEASNIKLDSVDVTRALKKKRKSNAAA
jgi:hypothetical protein